MIAKNFDLYKPETIEEAVEAYSAAGEHAAGDDTAGSGSGRYVLGGGTEIVTMARDGVLEPAALIDLKELPELRVLEHNGGQLTVGACTTLSDLAEWTAFPLLSRAAAGIADRTVRNSITLGGNIAGRLPYREAVLPFLLSDCVATVAGPEGQKQRRFDELFSKRLKLRRGEFLVSLSVEDELASAPYVYRRKTRGSRVDYPLMTLCAALVNGAVRFALSGVYGYPLRSEAAEQALVNTTGSAWERAGAAVAAIPVKPKSDMRGSAEYRRMLLTRALTEALEELA